MRAKRATTRPSARHASEASDHQALSPTRERSERTTRPLAPCPTALLISYRVEILESPQIEFVVHQRRRRIEAVVQRVLRQDLERRAVLDHERGAFLSGEVDPPFGADRRREH